MAQVEKHLPSRCKAPSSNPSTGEGKKKKKGKKGEVVEALFHTFQKDKTLSHDLHL
jgi:hypothetical protein